MVRPTLNIGFPVRILRRILHWIEPDSMAPLRRTAFAIQRAQSDMVARKCGRRAGEAAERLLHKHPRSKCSAFEPQSLSHSPIRAIVRRPRLISFAHAYQCAWE